MADDVVAAIEALMARGPSDREMLRGYVPQPDLDPELSEDILRAVAAFWCDGEEGEE